jgi:hypothetical protein
MFETVLWIGLVLVVLDVVATVFLIRSEAHTRAQKQLQAILIWLVPLVGASVVLYFTRYIATESSSVPPESPFPEHGPAALIAQQSLGTPAGVDAIHGPIISSDS